MAQAQDREAKNGASSQSEAEERKTRLDIIDGGGGAVGGEPRERIHCLPIIGHIEGHFVLNEGQKATKYEQLLPLLFEIEEDSDTDGLLVLLNTVGGDVEAGLAIAELIASLDKPTVSLVLGGGHSIGVPLAVSADLAFIVPTATMTVHPVRTSGLVVGVPQTYDYFARMQERIVGFITSHSRVSRDELNRLMMATDQLATDVGSIVSGVEAVECGLIDRIGGLSDALSALKDMIRRRRCGKDPGRCENGCADT